MTVIGELYIAVKPLTDGFNSELDSKLTGATGGAGGAMGGLAKVLQRAVELGRRRNVSTLRVAHIQAAICDTFPPTLATRYNAAVARAVAKIESAKPKPAPKDADAAHAQQ